MYLLDTTPEKVGGKHYDVVCNGYEIGGGSLRIYASQMQRKIFGLLGYSGEEVDELFGHLLEAFDYGAPPHGGIALGIDRRVALLSAHADSVRDVIAFPKPQSATDQLFRTRAPVTQEQLQELHIRIVE